ncbi:MAG: hypothetical protein E7678_08470 [Ruminococcaceae bacterium]|nr:hypothetical protein [Oscillospiraceae bacterium]
MEYYGNKNKHYTKKNTNQPYELLGDTHPSCVKEAFERITEDIELAERKRRASLYIRAHLAELISDDSYKSAYNRLVDEFIREYACIMLGEPIFTVSEKDIELEEAALDFEIAVEGNARIEEYKSDAIYIVKRFKAEKL